MKKGFTLIELLVVVLIIGILSAVALPQYTVAVTKSRYTQAVVLASSLYEAQQLYFLANGSYSTSLNELDIDLPSGEKAHSTDTRKYYDWGECNILENGVEIACSIIEGGDLMYLVVLTSNDRYCRYHGTSALGDKVCKSLGGNSKETKNGYTQYKLP